MEYNEINKEEENSSNNNAFNNNKAINESLDILIEQYKSYVGTINKMYDLKDKYNKLYLSLLTGLWGLISAFTIYIYKTKLVIIAFFDHQLILITAILLGISICYIWDKHINQFRMVIEQKYEIAKKMEKELAYPAFSLEYKFLKEKKYFIKLENLIPNILASFYFILLAWNMLQNFIKNSISLIILAVYIIFFTYFIIKIKEEKKMNKYKDFFYGVILPAFVAILFTFIWIYFKKDPNYGSMTILTLTFVAVLIYTFYTYRAIREPYKPFGSLNLIPGVIKGDLRVIIANKCKVPLSININLNPTIDGKHIELPSTLWEYSGKKDWILSAFQIKDAHILEDSILEAANKKYDEMVKQWSQENERHQLRLEAVAIFRDFKGNIYKENVKHVTYYNFKKESWIADSGIKISD